MFTRNEIRSFNGTLQLMIAAKLPRTREIITSVNQQHRCYAYSIQRDVRNVVRQIIYILIFSSFSQQTVFNDTKIVIYPMSARMSDLISNDQQLCYFSTFRNYVDDNPSNILEISYTPLNPLVPTWTFLDTRFL